ncbi:hypothetical protein ACLKA7_015013 [Drosophila subpalustris]
MANFQIHRDNEKENPSMLNLKEKSAMLVGAGAKQPLAVIGGKEKALVPRANLGVLSKNINHGNVPRGIPAPSGKVAFREVGNIRVDENAGYGGSNKSNVVPVEQFKTFSVYEDNIDTQVQLHLLPQAGKPLSNATEKENIHCGTGKFDSMHKEYPMQHGIDLDTTPMSVTDVLSPMSVDRSMADASSGQLSSENSLAENLANSNDVFVSSKLELLPRNDRQRFFEVVQYQHDILQYFRESEVKETSIYEGISQVAVRSRRWSWMELRPQLSTAKYSSAKAAPHTAQMDDRWADGWGK